jgi:hypothetical protein
MEVHINEIASTVRAMDDNTLLSPQTMEKILSAVLRAVEEREQYRDRVRAEQRITRGVGYELEEME